jgi:hypothetical protein
MTSAEQDDVNGSARANAVAMTTELDGGTGPQSSDVIKTAVEAQDLHATSDDVNTTAV